MDLDSRSKSPSSADPDRSASSTATVIPPQNLSPFISLCSLFPNHYQFSKLELVMLWVAEGLISDDDDDDEVFDLLVSMEVILLSGVDHLVDSSHLKTSCLLYKVNQSKINTSSPPLEYLIIWEGNTNLDHINITHPQKIQHLSIDSKSLAHLGPDSIQQFRNLHTLLFIPSPRFLPDKFPTIPLSYWNLKHLVSLNLSRSRISELPCSICKVKSLIYIDLSYTPIKSLPETITCLPNLQTLRLRGCLHLKQLPLHTGDLTSLRHLVLDVLRLYCMPPGMGNLTNLQTLSAFLVGKDDGCRIGELKNTINLTGALCISKLENVSSSEEAEEVDLVNKNFLTNLELRWTDTLVDDATKQDRILQNLQPPFGLEELTIELYSGFKLPSWISDSSYAHLVHIKLYCFFNCDCLPSIGQLPSLQSLRIIEMNEIQRIDDQFCRDRNRKGQHSQAFPSLKELTIEDMPALEEWTGVQNGDFPCLHKLKVDRCPKLITLSLLSCLSSLKHLEMTYCPNISPLPDGQVTTSLEFLLIKDCPQLKKSLHKGEGKDWRKIAHVPHIRIDDEVISRRLEWLSAGEMGYVSEAEILAFHLKQMKAKKKEIPPTTQAEGAEAADSSATESNSVSKRPSVASPAAVTQAAPVTMIPTSIAGPSVSPPPAPCFNTLWTQVLQNFEGSSLEPANSLWDSHFNYAEVVDQNLLLPGDVDKFSTLGAQQSCQYITASSLQVAFLARSMEKELIGFDKTKTKLRKDVEVANRRADKYADMAEELRREIAKAEEKRLSDEQLLQNRVAELEEELKKEKMLREEAQSATEAKSSEIHTLTAKLSTAETVEAKMNKVIFNLKSDLVNQFEAGFAKVVRQVTFLDPKFDTSPMDTFNVFRYGQALEPAEEEDEGN